MLKVGITGGIGSGKSTVCQVFETLGIPVLYADDTAKRLMDTDARLIDSIKKLLGPDVYKEGSLDRKKVASMVFNQPELLARLNKLVHPVVISYSEQWMKDQNSPYVIKEAAIFFESGSYKEMDVMIGVYAPEELRIQRTIARDNVTEEKVKERMAQQMDEEEKMKHCDYIITNDDMQAVIPQVLKIHQELLEKVAS